MILRYSSLSFILISCFMHLFCCGIPALMAITSLATVLGVSSGSLWEWEWYEAIESYILIASGILLIISGVSYYVSRKLDCSSELICSHEPCAPQKNLYRYLLLIAAVIYSFNLIVLLLS